MITDADIKKLEPVFVTKKDLEENTNYIVKELFNEFSKVHDRLNEIQLKTITNDKEIRLHRIILGNFEERLQNLEQKAS